MHRVTVVETCRREEPTNKTNNNSTSDAHISHIMLPPNQSFTARASLAHKFPPRNEPIASYTISTMASIVYTFAEPVSPPRRQEQRAVCTTVRKQIVQQQELNILLQQISIVTQQWKRDSQIMEVDSLARQGEKILGTTQKWRTCGEVHQAVQQMKS